MVAKEFSAQFDANEEAEDAKRAVPPVIAGEGQAGTFKNSCPTDNQGEWSASEQIRLGKLLAPKVKGQRSHVAPTPLHEEVGHSLEGMGTKGVQGHRDRSSGIAMEFNNEGR